MNAERRGRAIAGRGMPALTALAGLGVMSAFGLRWLRVPHDEGLAVGRPVSACAPSVRGVVRSALSGVPIASAVLTAWKLDVNASGFAAEPSEGTVADGQGHYEMQLRSTDEYIITAVCEPFATGSVRVAVTCSEGGSIDISVVPGASLSGTVLGPGEHSVPGARVMVEGELPIGSTVPGWHSRAVTTNSDGAFTIQGLRPGTLRLKAVRDDLASSESTFIPVRLSEHVTSLQVRVVRAHSISGLLRSRVDAAQAVARMWVSVRDPSTGSTWTAAQDTDSDGRFFIGGVLSGDYVFDVRRAGSLRSQGAERITISDADIVDRIVAIDPGVTVSGRVETVSAATVRAQRLATADGTSDQATPIDAPAAEVGPDHGQFVFHGIPPNVTIAVTAEGTDGSEGERLIHVGQHDEGNILVQLHPRSSFFGRVLDAAGKPVSGALAVLHAAAATRSELRDLEAGGWGKSRALFRRYERREYVSRYLLTDSGGVFEARGLGAGPYELRVYADTDSLGWVTPQDDNYPNDPLVFGLPETGISRENIHVRRCDGILTISVVSSQGAMAADIWVTATPETGADEAPDVLEVRERHSAFTDARGRASIESLCDDLYRISALSLSGYDRANRRRVRVGAEVNLSLEAPAVLTGAVHYRRRPVSDFVLSLAGPSSDRERVLNIEGRFRRPWLDPGTYELVVTAKDGYARRGLNLAPDIATDLSIPLYSWSSIRGHLVESKHGPASGIPVYLRIEESPERSYRILSNGDGEFVFDRLWAGKANLSFGRVGQQATIVETERGGRSGPSGAPAVSIALDLREEENLDLGRIGIRNE